MKINWKARFKNKAWLVAFISAVIKFTYEILGMFGVVPVVGSDTVTNLAMCVISILVTLGVILDPTTAGISDSERALSYTQPYKD